MHIITGEYPPTPGGVADYTAQVAWALARAGEPVHVWCPGEAPGDVMEHRVTVHRALGTLSNEDLARAGAMLDRYAAPRRLLVQWVPHAFGRRSLNLAFCRWIARRATAGDRIEIMVHEPFLPFTFAPKAWVAAAVHRVMTATLLRAADRVWVATPAWTPMWQPYALGRPVPFAVLPEPASVPVDPGAQHASRAVRERALDTGATLIGSFSAHSGFACATLADVVPAVLAARPDARWLAVGRGSLQLRQRLLTRAPAIAERIRATGPLESAALSAHLLACDVMVQPYPDGICTRHSSAMTILAHGVPIVTTGGRFTEPLWRQTGAVSLVEVGDTRTLAQAVTDLAGDSARRDVLGHAARDLYRDRFDVSHTVAALLGVSACG